MIGKKADRRVLSDEMWAVMRIVLREIRDPRGALAEIDVRAFLEGVLFLGRTGCPWRDLPESFGTWSSIYMRFRCWEKAGIWRALWRHLERSSCPASLEVFLESTSIPAHSHAA
jgi:transposase